MSEVDFLAQENRSAALELFTNERDLQEYTLTNASNAGLASFFNGDQVAATNARNVANQSTEVSGQPGGGFDLSGLVSSQLMAAIQAIMQVLYYAFILFGRRR